MSLTKPQKLDKKAYTCTDNMLTCTMDHAIQVRQPLHAHSPWRTMRKDQSESVENYFRAVGDLSPFGRLGNTTRMSTHNTSMINLFWVQAADQPHSTAKLAATFGSTKFWEINYTNNVSS